MEPSPLRARPSLRLSIALLAQAILLLMLVCLPFGFDHPSSLGLDFEDFLWMGGAYGCSLVAGLVLAVLERKWNWLVIQVTIPLVIITVLYLSSHTPGTIGPALY